MRQGLGMADVGQQVTDGINVDPAEVERLRAAREAVQQGRRVPRPEASYVAVRDPQSCPIVRTVEVSDGIYVDLDELGQVVGVERVGGTVNAFTLLAVLWSLRWPGDDRPPVPS